jgi:hypothetical protein
LETDINQQEILAKNLATFRKGLDEHDRQNPDHNTFGIGVTYFDLERMGLDDGEEIFPGIRIVVDGGPSGNFRILCDGGHGSDEEYTDEAAQLEVIGTVTI